MSVPDQPRIHGGLPRGELRALGLAVDDIVDFSVSCNPYGPAPAMRDAIRRAPIDRYPDPAATEAREALGALLDQPIDRIALGNGAAELLWTLAAVVVRPGAAVVIVEPTFGEWPAAAAHAGGELHAWRASADDGFAIDLAAVDRLIGECRAQVAYVCAPATPSGAAVPIDALRALAEAHPATTFVIDQSFLALSARFADAAAALPDNVVCVRSLTKDHAIPGVRVGYLLAAPALVARLERARASWTTGAPAQAAAIAACGATGFVADSRDRLLAARARLADQLIELGLAPAPSTTGFLVARVDRGPAGGAAAAAALRHRLLAGHRVLVRDCASFGLPDHIRIAARGDADTARLLDALRAELAR